MVKKGLSYVFTNLATRHFKGTTTLTTTRQTNITLLDHPITYSTPEIESHQTTIHHLTSELEGAVIHLMKLCPKCHTPQKDFSLANDFHRCHSCKILRKTPSYLSKCNGTLTIHMEDEEIGLSISNSILTKFMKQHHDMTKMDAQDIEEFLITAGPLSIEYTEENQIINLSKNSNPQPEDHNSDEELCIASTEHILVTSKAVEQSKPLTLKHMAQEDLDTTMSQLPNKLNKLSNALKTPCSTQTKLTENIQDTQTLQVPSLPSENTRQAKMTTKKNLHNLQALKTKKQITFCETEIHFSNNFSQVCSTFTNTHVYKYSLLLITTNFQPTNTKYKFISINL